MAQAGLQKVTDADCGNTILFAAGFKSNEIWSDDLYFSRVLNDENALLLRDEISE